MRAAWTLVLAVCLAAAGAPRPGRIEIRQAGHAAHLDPAVHVSDVALARRRAVAHPDTGIPPATLVAATTITAPPITILGPAPRRAAGRAARPIILPRSSRGPPLG